MEKIRIRDKRPRSAKRISVTYPFTVFSLFPSYPICIPKFFMEMALWIIFSEWWRQYLKGFFCVRLLSFVFRSASEVCPCPLDFNVKWRVMQ
jgi:hypothetical protein